jgi:hypothetical protein
LPIARVAEAPKQAGPAVPRDRLKRAPAAEPAGALRGLQASIGNHATARLVAGRRGAARTPMLQRQVLTSLDVREGHVWDVILGGRTPSPFPGTMGAHSTAWVAHLDDVRRIVVNRPLLEAADLLSGHISAEIDADADSLYSLREHLSEAHKKLLTAAKDAAQAALTALDEIAVETSDHVDVQAAMRRLIDRYLTFVNYLPAATVRGGDPRGHAEGNARNKLTYFEYVYGLHKRAGSATDYTKQEDPLLANAKSEAPTWVKPAFKVGFDPAQCPEVKQKVVESLWTMFAAETPGIFMDAAKAADPAHVWRLLLKHFLATIRGAYPYSYGFTNMHDPVAQIEGLQWAAKRAGVTFDLDYATISKDFDEPPKQRGTDEFAEVAASDIGRRGGTFRVVVLLAEPGGGSADGARTVGDVQMTGRTPSPFSQTMGAHTTAWIAHLDAMANLLRGKGLTAAITTLLARAKEGFSDPALKYGHLIDEKHQTALLRAYNALSRSIGAQPGAKATELEQVAYLEQATAEYLTYLNFLPLSTVAIGGVPGGRTEGKARKTLRAYEEQGARAFKDAKRPVKEILAEALLKMFDPKGLSAFPPQIVGERESPVWSKEELPPNHPLEKVFAATGTRAKGKREVAEDRLYRTLMEAYPRSMVDSGLMQEVDRPSAVAALPKQTDEEQVALNEMLHQNNCLIHAIADAAGVGLSLDQLWQIRLRIGEIGTMLIAHGRTVDIICDVLGVGGVVVVYPEPLPSEEFGDMTSPAMILHTGALHFVPYRPEAAEVEKEMDVEKKMPEKGERPAAEGERETKRQKLSGATTEGEMPVEEEKEEESRDVVLTD